MSQQVGRVIKFFMGLNDSYSQIRAQILMMDPIPPVVKTFDLVVQEERQRNIEPRILPPLEPINLLQLSILLLSPNVRDPYVH